MSLSLEHASEGRRVGPLGLIGLVLIPLLIAGGFVWATWDNTERLDNVNAAIVNNDEPVEVQGQTVPLGRQLAAGLMKDAEDDQDSEDEDAPQQNYNWSLSSNEDAVDGLKSGKYAAVVIIPENFSAAATSYSDKDPENATQATLDVRVSQMTKIIDPALSQAIVGAAKSSLNSELTSTYLDNIYLGFNEMSKQFTTVADAAGQLDDGAQQLSKGLDDAHDGSTEFSTGLGDLSDGAGQLADGTQGLATGTGDLATGLGQLADGGKTLETGTSDLADGMEKLGAGGADLRSGTSDLSDGLAKLDTGGADLRSGTSDLSDGLGKLDKGGKDLRTGTSDLADGLGQLKKGTKDLPQQAKQLDDGAQELSSGAADLSDGTKQLAGGAKQLNQGMPALEDGSKELAGGAKGLSSGLKQYQNQAPEAVSQKITCETAEITDPVMCAVFEKGVEAGATGAAEGLGKPKDQESLIGGATALSGGASELSKGINGTKKQPGLSDGVQQLATGSADLSKGAGALAKGTEQFADGTGQLKDGIPTLQKGIAGAADGAQELSDGTATYTKGVSSAAKGAKELSKGTTTYTKGVSGAAKGAKELSKGTTTYTKGVSTAADGARQLADGVPALTKGMTSSADGAEKLADGARQVNDGATGLADGAKTASDGATELSSGLGKLSTGASQLATGTEELHRGTSKGAKQIPTYTSSERQNLSTVVAAPVGDDSEEATLFSDVSAAAFLTAVALWLGALATYLIVAAVPRTALNSMRPSWLLALQRLLPGWMISAVAAVGLTIITANLLDLGAGQTAGVFGFSLLAGVTFVAVNHALVAAFGGVGRFISVALVVLTAAGSLMSTVPTFFDAIRPLLPLAPAMEGIQAVAGDGSGAGGQFGMLLAWLVVALAGSVLAIARRRQTSADALLGAYAR